MAAVKLQDAPGLSGPPDAHDYGEAIASRIAAMDLREECDTYRAITRRLGHRPSGFRFGEWLRDRVMDSISADDYARSDL